MKKRLEQLASLTETNAQQILELRASVASLLSLAGQHQEKFEVVLAEIRGIGAENRRILDRLSIVESSRMKGSTRPALSESLLHADD